MLPIRYVLLQTRHVMCEMVFSEPPGDFTVEEPSGGLCTSDPAAQRLNRTVLPQNYPDKGTPIARSVRKATDL